MSRTLSVPVTTSVREVRQFTRLPSQSLASQVDILISDLTRLRLINALRKRVIGDTLVDINREMI